MILALDTTGQVGSVALIRNGAIEASREFVSSSGFNDILFGEIEALLAEAGHSFGQIDCYASASGPGSFTGVRIGLAAVKGLGEVFARPVCGVSNLRALTSFRKTTQSPLVTMADARRGAYYLAHFDDQLRLLEPEAVAPLESWLGRLGLHSGYEFVSQNATEAICTALASLGFDAVSVTQAPASLAGSVGQCAEEDGQAGLWVDPAALDANYVRTRDATFAWQDR